MKPIGKLNKQVEEKKSNVIIENEDISLSDDELDKITAGDGNGDGPETNTVQGTCICGHKGTRGLLCKCCGHPFQ